ncbi:MAG: LuxR C-terminal-related transcriptional regulator [Synergistaceae bacterium]|jgi:LuxR family maltose regulon positive regulatory protein|nr:LuxR C-terminal-related transcriptional regulator [Synergistaceae bacterium]
MNGRAETNEIFQFSGNLLKCMNNICKMPITLMSAPVGYGKTTVLREFFSRTNTNYRLISISRSCTTETLWSVLRGALISCAESGGKNVISWADMLPEKFPHNPAAVSEAFTAINRLDFQRKTVIIFDDFHNVEFPEAAIFLSDLAKTAVPNLHLLISSRHDVPYMRDLLISGCVNIVTTKAFILSEEEIVKIFQAHDIALSEKQARALYNYTDGWPALIHNILVSVTLTGNIDASSISAFENNVVRSLIDVVYRPLPDECKELLLRMCDEKSFTCEQAEFVHDGNEESSLFPPCPVCCVLERIRSLNAFVLYENNCDRPVYKIHNFFSKALHSQFSLLPEETRMKFQKKMGDWFFQNGSYYRAAMYYRCADDPKSFFMAYEWAKLRGGSPDVFLMLLSLYAREAENLPSHSALGVITFAVEMYFHGASSIFQEIHDALAERVSADPRAQAEMEIVLCATDDCDITKNASRVKRASRLVKGWLRDKIDFVYSNPSILFLYHKTPGFLDETVDAFAQLTDDYRALVGAGDSSAHLLLKAEVLYCRGKFEQADAVLRVAQSNSLKQSELGVWTACRFLMARIRLVKGDVEGAFSVIGDTSEKIASYSEGALKKTLDLCECFLDMMLERSDNFVPWIFSETYEDRLIRPLIPFASSLRGVCLVKSGRTAEIIGCRLSDKVPRSPFGGVMSSIFDNLAMSMALAEIRDFDGSSEALISAMNLAIPDGLYAPFFEACPANWAMFDKVSKNEQAYRSFVCAVRERGRRLGGARNLLKVDAEIFTKREKEILSLLQSGLRNKDIADELCVSENTVKSALKGIFRKKGVTSRKALLRNR